MASSSTTMYKTKLQKKFLFVNFAYTSGEVFHNFWNKN